MRHTILLLLFGLLGSGLFLGSCQKDPCQEKLCENGGYCNDGTCICPDGYEGEWCNQKIYPSSVTIQKVELLDYPIKRSPLLYWDSTDPNNPQAQYPDVFICINKEQPGTFASQDDFSSNIYFGDATGESLLFNDSRDFPITLDLSPGNHYWFSVWDYNFSTLSNNQLMAQVAGGLIPGVYDEQGEVSPIIIESSGLFNDYIRFKVYLTWNK